MPLRRPIFIVMLLLIAGAIVLSGCAVKASGGGSMDSADGSSKANFGFTFDGTKDHFKGTYHDRGSDDVRIRFTELVSYTGPGFFDQCTSAVVAYESQDRRNAPGSGTAYFEACDEGGPGADTLFIEITSGPYAGYSNSGSVKGNVTAHD